MEKENQPCDCAKCTTLEKVKENFTKSPITKALVFAGIFGLGYYYIIKK